jgi:hypothetical protein
VVPVPTIASVSPASGSTSGGTNITITGTNFTGATSVKVNGVAATNVVVTATSITAKTPAGTVGAKSVAVTTTVGTATKASAFTYLTSFAGAAPNGDGNATDNGSGVTGVDNNGDNSDAGQSTNNSTNEVAAPMGVQLYLQTIITQPDADVECLDAQSSNTNVVPVAAIDLDDNGEADICQLRRGDLDLNGVIDQNDLAILFDMIGTAPILGIGDMDVNGVIDESDMSMLLQKM